MNLHLTRVQISYEIAAKWRQDGGFRDSYAWHKRAWDCFPNSPHAKRQFLTRVDDIGDGLRLLLLSAEVPERPSWCSTDAWHCKKVAESFLSHQRYHFSLLANPTKKLAVARDEAGRRCHARRVPLVRREDLLAWLERKALQHGFAIIDPGQIRTIPRPRKPFIKAGKAGVHGATEFTGTLSVIDSTSFREAFAGGIGSAKAFGFGMLCISPV